MAVHRFDVDSGALRCRQRCCPEAGAAGPYAVMQVENEVVMPNGEMFSMVEGMLRDGCDVTLRARGGSMLPFIVGDRDSVRIRRKERYEVGDVVLGKVGKDFYVLHRIVEVCNERFVMLMGDGNLAQREKCYISDISGAVVEIIGRNGRRRPVRKGRLWRILPLSVRRVLLILARRVTGISKGE